MHHSFLIPVVLLIGLWFFLCDHRDKIKRFIISSVNTIVIFTVFTMYTYPLILLFENIFRIEIIYKGQRAIKLQYDM